MTGGSAPRVVVVGAGPVGACAAVLLAREGLEVVLLERGGSLTTLSHASTFHPVTLDLLTGIGIDLAADPRAVPVRTVQWRDHDGSLRAELDYGLLAGLTRHPFRIHLDQQVLLDRLADVVAAEPGVELRTGTTALGLAGPREVQLRDADGWVRTLRADAVVAADGARSVIRDAAGLRLAVRGYPTVALRARTSADLAARLPRSGGPLAALCYFRGSDDGVSALRMSEVTRLVVRARPGDDPASRVAAALAAATPWSPGELEFGDVDVYRLSRGVVDSLYAPEAGVLAIGDAAHLTSTAGGLNMNSGLHDAFALMPRLADVLLGRGRVDELRRAADRRRDFVRDEVIPRSERRVRGLQDERDTNALHHHLDDVAALAADPAAARRFLVEASLLDAAGIDAAGIDAAGIDAVGTAAAAGGVR